MKNVNEKNCYCGQRGNNAMNMLYCVKCKRWLHEECVKCLDVRMLYGDRFYILICSVCNAGSECLARVQLTWPDVLHLVLYNLTVIHKTKYFDLDKCILPFIEENWERLRLFGPVTSVKSEDRRIQVLEVLTSDKRFKSGREIKKCKNIFGLRQRIPPDSPAVQPSGAKLKNDVVIWEFQVKERPYQILTSTKSKEIKEKAKSKPRRKLTQNQSKQKEVSKCWGDLPHNENGTEKTKIGRKRLALPEFREESAVKGLLDSLIPISDVFNTENNPFSLSAKVKSALREKTPTLPETEVKKDVPSRSLKRRHNGDLISENGSHKTLEKTKSNVHNNSMKNSDNSLFGIQNYLNGDMTMAKEEGLCIIGKRLTKTGKVQHLFQRNRRNVMPEPGSPFALSFLCNCTYCKILDQLSC